MPILKPDCNGRPKTAWPLSTLLVLVFAAGPAHTADAESVLREAFQRSMSRPTRFEGALVRFDSNGRIDQRSRWRFERDGKPGEGRVKVTFVEPPDLHGVTLLIRPQSDRPAEQWLYTPATDRARRVRPEARGRRFYSTDFTFDDLQEADVGLETYRLTGRQQAAGEDCWRIEAQTSPGSLYDQKVFFVSVAEGVLVQTDHLIDLSRVKRLIYRDYQDRDGVWLPGRIEAVDIESGTRTVVSVENPQIDVEFSETTFEPEWLGSP